MHVLHISFRLIDACAAYTKLLGVKELTLLPLYWALEA